MKIALIGFGAMGQLVAELACRDGDEIGLQITSRNFPNSLEDFAEKLRGHDVAIDFSVGAAVPLNVEACCVASVPMVEGTTGWNAEESHVREIVRNRNGALVYAANFSIGVNLFYRIVEHAAELFQAVDAYAPFIEEAHHGRKRDAPSGTAVRLRKLLSEKIGCDIPVSSTRAGHIPGTHKVGFDSEPDQILLTHMARSREGFAAGALLAARWIVGRKGVYEFSQMMDQVLST